MRQWFIQLLRAPDGDASIKRILATIITLSLITSYFIGPIFHLIFDANVIQCLLWVDGLCIGGTVAEKYSPQITNLINKPQTKP